MAERRSRFLDFFGSLFGGVGGGADPLTDEYEELYGMAPGTLRNAGNRAASMRGLQSMLAGSGFGNAQYYGGAGYNDAVNAEMVRAQQLQQLRQQRATEQQAQQRRELLMSPEFAKEAGLTPQMQQILAAVGPDSPIADKIFEQAITPKEKIDPLMDPKFIGDPEIQDAMAQGAFNEVNPQLQQIAQAAINARQQRALAQRQAGRAPGTTVVLPAGETEADKTAGRHFEDYKQKWIDKSEGMASVADSAAWAVEQMGDVQIPENLVAGQFQGIEVGLPIRTMYQGLLGLGAFSPEQTEALSKATSADALAKGIVNELRKAAGGDTNFSDADRQFFLSMVPQLNTNPEVRRKMAARMRMIADRTSAIASIASSVPYTSNDRGAARRTILEAQTLLRRVDDPQIIGEVMDMVNSGAPIEEVLQALRDYVDVQRKSAGAGTGAAGIGGYDTQQLMDAFKGLSPGG